MKNLLIALVIPILAACASNEANDKQLSIHFHQLNESELYRLFDHSIVANNQIHWKPGYDDLAPFESVLQHDSICHSEIDTILQSGDVHYVLFRTDTYHGSEKDDCHACAPIIGIAYFEHRDNLFHLMQFKKCVFSVGQFGDYGAITIDNLLKPCLKVSSEWTGTGAQIFYDKYYDMFDFTEIFSITTHSSNGGMYEANEPYYESIDKMILHKSDTSFVIKTTQISIDSTGQMTQSKQYDQITFSEEYGRHLLFSK